MISMYEAAAQSVQQSAKPVQASGDIATQQDQQQTTTDQVPAQQPQSNAGTSNSPTGPNWKKYLKYAAITGGAIAGGALLHDIYHNGGISNWAHNRFGNIHMPSWNMFGGTFAGGGGETQTEDNPGAESTTNGNATTERTRNVSGVKTIYRPLPMKRAPQGTPTVDPATYVSRMPQPANKVKRLGGNLRQGYSSTNFGYSGGEWADNYESPYGYSRSNTSRGNYVRPTGQPIGSEGWIPGIH